MSAKLLLYFTGAEHSLYRWAGGALELESSFGADAQGLQAFRTHLQGRHSQGCEPEKEDIAGVVDYIGQGRGHCHRKERTGEKWEPGGPQID